ncbi:hypothetical protein A0H81_05118 [Grifola frondosa]|uniref:DUF6532 domain-containing protein n=1 Tax=Grifola frondosa TaxID=5627 RepID=A0A1C7MBY8_GRIFR|nr:hypothetical protein A0H81_05118 [Grifola frondosa]
MPIVTRASNAQKHPGLVVPRQKHRTKVEMAAVRAAEEEEREEKVKSQSRKQNRVAHIENQIKNADEEIEAGRVTRSRPLKREGAVLDITKVDEEKKRKRPRRKDDTPAPGLGATQSSAVLSQLPRRMPRRKSSSTRPVNDSWDSLAMMKPAAASSKKGKGATQEKDKESASNTKSKLAKEATSVPRAFGLKDDWTVPESSTESGWASSVMPTTESSRSAKSSESLVLPPPPTPEVVKTSKKSKRKTAQVSNYKTPLNVGRGFISEDEGIEREAAHSSPIKGKGRRITSDGMVTVTKKHEPSDSEREPELKFIKSEPRSEFVLGDHDLEDLREKKRRGTSSRSVSGSTSSKEKAYKLPPEVNARFKKVVMLTLLRFVASLDNPWSFIESGSANAPDGLEVVRTIWIATFGTSVDPPEPINLLSTMITQRLSEWRCGMGNTAINTLDRWFKQSQVFAFDHSARAKKADAMMEGLAFLYERPLSKGGLFCSPLVIKTLVHHFSCISGAINVPKLYESEADSWPIGAIAMAGAAVERALWLYAEERVIVKPDNKIEYIPKPFTERDAPEGKNYTQFSDIRWGGPTRLYVKSVLNLGAERIRKIAQRAGPAVIIVEDEDEDTTRAMLVDNDPISD